MKRIFIVGMLALAATTQSAQALEVHPVGLAKTAVTKTVSLAKSVVSAARGALSRTLKVVEVTGKDAVTDSTQGLNFIINGGG